MVHLLPTEHRDLLEVVDAFGRHELAPLARAHEAARRFPVELWQQASGMDLASLPHRVEAGGGGVGWRTMTMVIEELSRHFVSLGTALGVHGAASSVIVGRQSFEPIASVVDGASLATSRIDAAPERPVATPVDGGHRLDGNAGTVALSGLAEHHVVTADLADGLGLAVFVIDPGRPGHTLTSAQAPALGSLQLATSRYQGVHVPDHLQLADGNAAAARLRRRTRLMVGAALVGLCQAALDHAGFWARATAPVEGPSRAINDRLASIATTGEAARQLLRSAADRHDHGFDVDDATAMALRCCAEAAVSTTTLATEVHAVCGDPEDDTIARYATEARVLADLVDDATARLGARLGGAT